MKRAILSNMLMALAIFILSILLFAKITYMGVSDANLQKTILGGYMCFIVSTNLKILACYLILALVLALFALLLRLERVPSILLFSALLWGTAWMRAIKIYPQMFSEQLFARGGPWRVWQVFITDVAPLWSILFLPLLIVLAIAWRKKSLAGGILITAALCAWFFPFHTPPLRQSARPASPASPNILILASDSLRPDHIHYNGYPRPTPHIDSLFARGGNFLSAGTSLARTFPEWTTILTSLYPPQHGIRHMFPTVSERRKRWTTLVDVLRNRGYFTAVISDFAGDMFSGIDLGFERVEAPEFTIKALIRQRSLEIHYFFLSFLLAPPGKDIFPVMYEMPLNPDPYFLNEKAKRNINRAGAGKRPFFIVTFYAANHFPYCPPYPYYRLYTDPRYRGAHKYKKENLLAEYGEGAIDPADRRQIVALYDGGVRLFDDAVGDMKRYLSRAGIDRDTIVLIMSDHGENLYDENHGMGHGDHLRGDFANLLTLGITSPYESFAGRRIRPMVRDIDIAPTILDLAGIPAPASFRGQSLLPFLRGQPQPALMHYLETGMWYTHSVMAIRGGRRMLYPEIMDLLEIDRATGLIVLRDRYRWEVINAKHRALMLDSYKYILMADEDGVSEEVYDRSRPQSPENRIHPVGEFSLGKFRNRLLRLFPGLFSKLANGQIVEKGSFPDSFIIPPRKR